MTTATQQFFNQTDLDHSLLVGYYGGGNYGDELLLEILQNILHAKRHRDITIYYQKPEAFALYHHDHGYQLADGSRPQNILKHISKADNIIIGGGGLWGMDTNLRVLLLSMLLFAARYVLRKRIYLVGVGYYGSAGVMGRIGAYFAAKAATQIIARDDESTRNFAKHATHVTQDTDLAWLLESLPLDAYQKDLSLIEARVRIQPKTLCIALRHFRGAKGQQYLHAIETYITQNTDRPLVILVFEPQEQFPEAYEKIKAWQQYHGNLQVIDGAFNPMALVLLFKKYHQQLALVAPQFHLIISAKLADVPFLPLAYDNKVSQLLQQLHVARPIPVGAIVPHDVQTFADQVLQRTGT